MKARSFFRVPRLLPIVLAVGTPLLVLKGAGLVHDAKAEEAAAASQTQDAQTQTASNDPAGEDAPSATAAEVGVLTSLSKRRAQLDAQQQQISMQQNLLAATEQRVDDKIALLKQLQGQIEKLLAQRDTEQEKQVAALVKTYSSMKPKDAARIFNSLDDEVLIPVAQEMKPDVLGPILANMQPEQAQKLTVKLADRLHVPDPQLPPQAPPASSASAAPVDPSALAAALAPETPTGAQTQPGPLPQIPPQAPAAPAPQATTKPPTGSQATAPMAAPAKAAAGTQASAPQAAPAATAHGG